MPVKFVWGVNEIAELDNDMHPEALATIEKVLPLLHEDRRDKYNVKRIVLMLRSDRVSDAIDLVNELLSKDKPQAVLILQVFLKNQGFSSVAITGAFDDNTQSALRDCLSQSDCSGKLGTRI